MNNTHNNKTVRSTCIIDANSVDYLYQSITPELKTIGTAGERASVTVKKTPKKLVISIKASDITSCRAATNSWLRLALIATDIDELIAAFEKKYSTAPLNLD